MPSIRETTLASIEIVVCPLTFPDCCIVQEIPQRSILWFALILLPFKLPSPIGFFTLRPRTYLDLLMLCSLFTHCLRSIAPFFFPPTFSSTFSQAPVKARHPSCPSFVCTRLPPLFRPGLPDNCVTEEVLPSFHLHPSSTQLCQMIVPLLIRWLSPMCFAPVFDPAPLDGALHPLFALHLHVQLGSVLHALHSTHLYFVNVTFAFDPTPNDSFLHVLHPIRPNFVLHTLHPRSTPLPMVFSCVRCTLPQPSFVLCALCSHLT